MAGNWQFWIDRGGTFTDIVAQTPTGAIRTHKLLSVCPDRYDDAPVAGIRYLLGLGEGEPLPDNIEVIRMGTTVATNALLERQGEPTVLVITQGFGDGLYLGYQNRPDLFALEPRRPAPLYNRVIEVQERVSAQGEILKSLDREGLRRTLEAAYRQGWRSCAIAFLHGYRYPNHEIQAGRIAQAVGFEQISLSHEVSAKIKLVSRGETTVVDAYLSPVLRRYVDQVQGALGSPSPRLLFMQSHGGLVTADCFRGKDSILSGPAGGLVGAIQVGQQAGITKMITFDMGGTSTDVAHYAGQYERQEETQIAGVRFATPTLAIHTVAAGGGSILHFDGQRYRVGPDSAGADPGPASYGRGGPLTVTDANVFLGKIQPDFFPQVFGPQGDRPLNLWEVQRQFRSLAERIDDGRSPEAVAAGFLAIAVDNMARAIQSISGERGYDLADYTLCCFGGAGGQHACLLAQQLGMKRILIHPYAGVLSAYGMGLAAIRILKEITLEIVLDDRAASAWDEGFSRLRQWAQIDRQAQHLAVQVYQEERRIALKYQGTDTSVWVDLTGEGETSLQLREKFERLHEQYYGFVRSDYPLTVATIALEWIFPGHAPQPPGEESPRQSPLQALTEVDLYTGDRWEKVPLYGRADLRSGDEIFGPALIAESTGTNVIEGGWHAQVMAGGEVLLTPKDVCPPTRDTMTALTCDPLRLELMHNRFRAIAEQMGKVLQHTSHSVNIKERLDFSCAIFDQNGDLVANAPHIPVHLGSMGESVRSLIRDRGGDLAPGQVYATNNPYNGGTHLPDITVITPVFGQGPAPSFFVASRGHHGDIGGITPGSMPPHSTHLEEEGILLDHFLLVERGEFQGDRLRHHLHQGPYPARNPDQNLADLQAQIAANHRGVQELATLVGEYGEICVQRYMGFVQDNAARAVENLIPQLFPSDRRRSFSLPLDQGGQIEVNLWGDRAAKKIYLDFTGTSPQGKHNFNAPRAIALAVILYVFRTLIPEDIPLNQGCLRPLEIHIPLGCLLNPLPPAAVVAGNVETSQLLADCLYGALDILAASQGTMNNFIFGNDRYQYYETICGGSGAGVNHHGVTGIQTHMTNSRLTDPEVLEWRFPVRVERFMIRPRSGGIGTFQGGDGAIREISFQAPFQVSLISSRRETVPFGLAGGHPGQGGQNIFFPSQGSPAYLPAIASVQVQPGDRIIIATPGGGGYGRPL